MVALNTIRLNDEDSSSEVLHLPSYWRLEITVLNVPWGSKNEYGSPLKVVWRSIVIATALKQD